MKQLQGLISFIEIADAGSFAAAARRLDVTPAAVSKNLQRLEAQLGVRLLHRNTRGVRLTNEGGRFLDQARDALRALDHAVEEISERSSKAVGRVRISCSALFGRRWILPALPALSLRHAALQIELDLDNRAVELIGEGFDIGIRGGAPAHASLVSRSLCRMPVVLVASPGYLRAHGIPRTTDALLEHRCIQQRFSDGSTGQWLFRRGRRRAMASPVPDAALVASESEAVVDLAVLGAGIAQVGIYGAIDHLRAGRLKRILPDVHDPGSREFNLHYPHRQFLAPRTRVVVDALLAHVRMQTDLQLGASDLPAKFNA
ncbi:MAG: LysR family transcriptional regulator [Burkholderiaceae bacterium]